MRDLGAKFVVNGSKKLHQWSKQVSQRVVTEFKILTLLFHECNPPIKQLTQRWEHFWHQVYKFNDFLSCQVGPFIMCCHIYVVHYLS